MPLVVFTNAKVVIGPYNMSADLNQVTLDYSSEMLDATTFGQNTRVRKGGLETSRVTGRGFVQFGTALLDESIFNDLMGLSVPVALFPTGLIEGSTSTGSGYAFPAIGATYRPGGAVGELTSFDFTAEGAGP